MFVSKAPSILSTVGRGALRVPHLGKNGLRQAAGLMVMLVTVATADGAEYFVDGTFSGTADGSAAKPFTTIRDGLVKAVSGDTVWVRGGTYRGQITGFKNSISGAPVTLAAWTPDGDPANCETVILDPAPLRTPSSGSGTTAVGAWESVGSGRWRIALPSALLTSFQKPADHARMRVTLGGKLLQLARWPNTTRIPDNTLNNVAWSTAGSTTYLRDTTKDSTPTPDIDRGEYTIPDLAAAGFADNVLKDALLTLNPGKMWYIQSGTVLGHTGGTLSFAWKRGGGSSSGSLDPSFPDWVVLSDKLELLDQSDEFWIDYANNHLYVKPAESPIGQELAAGGTTLISLSGISNYTIKDLRVVGGSISGDAATRNITLSGLELEQSIGSAVSIDGQGWTVRDCTIRNGRNTGIVMQKTAENVLIEQVTVGNMIGSGFELNNATAVTFRNSTLFDLGGAGASFIGYNSELAYLHVYRTGKMNSDLGMVNCFNNQSVTKALNTRVHHSWVHSPLSKRDPITNRWLGNPGIRTDTGGTNAQGLSGVTIDHNIVWGEGIGGGIQVSSVGDVPGSNPKVKQTGWGDLQIQVVNNTVIGSGGSTDANIGIIFNGNAKGITIANNVAGGYSIDKGVRDGTGTEGADTAPTAVVGNIFTNFQTANNLPVDNDSRTDATRNLTNTDPRFAGAVNRLFEPAADSPLVGRTVDNPITGSERDAGAIQRGAAPWLAGALVQPRHVKQLILEGRRSVDGAAWAVLTNLPTGRLMPLATSIRVGSTTLRNGQWRYDSLNHAGSLWFATGGITIPDGAGAWVDLDGDGTAVAERQVTALTRGFAVKVTSAIWNATERTLTIGGTGFFGSPWPLRQLALANVAASDLRERPMLALVSMDGATPERFDLLANSGSDLIALDTSHERTAAGRLQGWAVLPEEQGAVFGPAANLTVYSTARTGGGPRNHTAGQRPTSGPSGRPEQTMWGSLATAKGWIAMRFSPEVLTLDDGQPVASVGGLAPAGLATAPTAVADQPKFYREAVGGLPGLRFDGKQKLTSDGLSGGGAITVIGVYRNADANTPPSDTKYQRLISVPANPDGGAKWELIVDSIPGNGQAIARGEPWLTNFSRGTATAARGPLRFGHDLVTKQDFTGWMGEFIVLSVPGSGDYSTELHRTVRSEVQDFLATKYQAQPAGRLVDDGRNIIVPALTATYAGKALTAVSVSPTQLTFTYTGADQPPATGPVTLTLPDGSKVSLDQPGVNVVGDTTPPGVPAAPKVSFTAFRPTISGTSEPGATITIFDQGVSIGTAVADSLTGVWTWTGSAAWVEGSSHLISATATDSAGNKSAPSPATAVVVTNGTTAGPPTSSSNSDAGGGGGGCGAGLVAVLACFSGIYCFSRRPERR